jgi:hypothetical protein
VTPSLRIEWLHYLTTNDNERAGIQYPPPFSLCPSLVVANQRHRAGPNLFDQVAAQLTRIDAVRSCTLARGRNDGQTRVFDDLLLRHW